MGKYFKQTVKKGRARSKPTKTTKVKKESKPINMKLLLGVVGGIIVVVIIIMILVLLIKMAKAEQLVPYDSIDVDINSKMPKAKDFFKTYKNANEDNIEIDYGDLTIDKVGEYGVTITYGKDHKKKIVNVSVDDYSAPEVIFKDVEIKENETYKLTDFQEKCVDNFGKCYLEYVNPEDATIKKAGTHKIKIRVFDDNQNEIIQEVTLKIVKNKTKTEVKCDYGTLEVHKNEKDIPILYYVGNQETGCAVSPQEDISEDLRNKLTQIANNDIASVHKQIDEKINNKYVEKSNMIVYPYFKAVYNSDGTGIIGYAVRIEIYADTTSNLKESYYIKGDGSRYYLTNEYNLT